MPPAEWLDFSGKVADEDGNAVAGAKVVLFAGSNHDDVQPVRAGTPVLAPGSAVTQLTNRSGGFAWRVRPGVYEAVATKAGCRVPKLQDAAEVAETSSTIRVPQTINGEEAGSVKDADIVLDCRPLDWVPPVIEILSAPPAVTTATEVTIDFRVTDNNPGVTTWCFLEERMTEEEDYSSFECSGPQVLRGLGEGRHVFVIVAGDYRSNVESEEIVFTVKRG